MNHYKAHIKTAIITVVLLRESISECHLPESPAQDKSVFRIPVGGMPATSSTSIEDEDERKS
jgi:hypothetical protein